MKRTLGFILILAYLGVAFTFDALQAANWVYDPPRPVIEWLEKLDSELPADARILMVVPQDRLTLDHYRVNTWLHPRAVYPLPWGATSVEEASTWMVAKKISWIVFIGDESFDPARAYARKVNDAR